MALYIDNGSNADALVDSGTFVFDRKKWARQKEKQARTNIFKSSGPPSFHL